MPKYLVSNQTIAANQTRVQLPIRFSNSQISKPNFQTQFALAARPSGKSLAIKRAAQVSAMPPRSSKFVIARLDQRDYFLIPTGLVSTRSMHNDMR